MTRPEVLVYVVTGEEREKTADYCIGEDDEGEKNGEEDNEDFDREDEKARTLTRCSTESWSGSLLTLLGTRRGHCVPFPCSRRVTLLGSHRMPLLCARPCASSFRTSRVATH